MYNETIKPQHKFKSVLGESEPNKKGFNKIFLAIPVIAVALIVLLALTSANTDVKEHEIFREVQVLDHDVYVRS